MQILTERSSEQRFLLSRHLLVSLIFASIATVSIVSRAHLINTRPLAGRLDDQEPESHILITDLAFEQTPWTTHHFLPLFTLGARYNKDIDEHPNAESTDNLGNYYYTSTPPLTFVIPYFALKITIGTPSLVGLRWYNLALQIIIAIALGGLVYLCVRRPGADFQFRLLVSMTAALIYMTAPECLKSHTITLWAQQFY
jgi:hypothetical protein